MVGKELAEPDACGHRVRPIGTTLYRGQWWLKQEAPTSISRGSSHRVDNY